MADIESIFNEVVEICKDIDSAVLVHTRNGNREFSLDGERAQIIEAEFDGPVPAKYKTTFLELGNRTDWEFVNEDNVFTGENDGNGIISISRDVAEEDVKRPEFSEDKYFRR